MSPLPLISHHLYVAAAHQESHPAARKRRPELPPREQSEPAHWMALQLEEPDLFDSAADLPRDPAFEQE